MKGGNSSAKHEADLSVRDIIVSLERRISLVKGLISNLFSDSFFNPTLEWSSLVQLVNRKKVHLAL